MSNNWSPNYTKLGPPKNIRPRPYHPTLELLETESNKRATEDYEQDIYNYLSLVENNNVINCSMIDLQPEIQWYMRPYLLDFLVEIHQSFRLHPQTLFLAVNIIDKYCSKRVVFKRHYQLVGCTALWLAAKYEDKKSRVPTLKELTIMCRNAYDTEMFVQMERHILSTLDWCLIHTSLEDCLQISLKNSLNFIDKTPRKIYNKNYHGLDLITKIESVARLFCDLSLYERNFLQYPPSVVALSCHLLASRILGSESAVEAYEYSVYLYLQNNREVDDDETFDENLENTYPTVIQPFLSGFSEYTVNQILQIGILLINQFKSCSHALQNKYKNMQDGFNCIEIVQNFLSCHQNLTQLFPDTDAFNDSKEIQISTELRYTASYIVGLTSEYNAPSVLTSVPQVNTPPSASSAISSLFSSNEFQGSNYSSSSVNLTPVTSTSSPIDSTHYHPQQQHNRNVFYQSGPNTTDMTFKKPQSIPDPDYSTFLNKRQRSFNSHQHPQAQYFSDSEADEERPKMMINDPNCPASSPLAQRSQNKINMMVQ